MKLPQPIRNNINYIIIGLISFMVIVCFPFFGTALTAEALMLPTSAAEWVVYLGIKALVATCNVLIFVCFVHQGRQNVKDDPHYLWAMEHTVYGKPKKERKPLSPHQWLARQYLRKGTLVFVSTLLASFVLIQAIITYDFFALISYLVMITGGIISGLLQMKATEEYWTEEFYEYAVAQPMEETNNDNN